MARLVGWRIVLEVGLGWVVIFARVVSTSVLGADCPLPAERGGLGENGLGGIAAVTGAGRVLLGERSERTPRIDESSNALEERLALRGKCGVMLDLFGIDFEGVETCIDGTRDWPWNLFSISRAKALASWAEMGTASGGGGGVGVFGLGTSDCNEGRPALWLSKG